VYGFLGPNGAGKRRFLRNLLAEDACSVFETTTMRMLTTLSRLTEGEARIIGDPVKDRDAVVRHIGYLPETPSLYEELTSREQLEYAAFLHDADPDAARVRAEPSAGAAGPDGRR